jgi:hypothetical protein
MYKKIQVRAKSFFEVLGGGGRRHDVIPKIENIKQILSQSKNII